MQFAFVDIVAQTLSGFAKVDAVNHSLFETKYSITSVCAMFAFPVLSFVRFAKLQIPSGDRNELGNVLDERNAEVRSNTWSETNGKPNRRDQASLQPCLLRQWRFLHRNIQA